MAEATESVPPIRLFRAFLKLGMTAFGGPAMVAHIRELSVERCRWLSKESFMNGVVLCQSMPGATAMQTAGYVGLRSGGLRGAFASYVGFGLPAFLLMVALSVLYNGSRQLPLVVSLFQGLQVIVVAIVANATSVFGREIARRRGDLLLAPAAAALFWLGVSPFLVIVGAAAVGIAFLGASASSPLPASGNGNPVRLSRAILVLISLACLAVGVLYFVDRRLYQLAAAMLRIDLFAFGGGFASLPLMFHEIVNVRGWMDGRTFMDGIALGQVTPGPIVITATFVGYLAGGIPGSLVATVAIFTPSFVVLVAATPFFDRLNGSRYFSGATRGILASFVGLLFYMTARFAVAVPWDAVRALFGVAVFLALARKLNLLYIVLAGAALSIFLFR